MPTYPATLIISSHRHAAPSGPWPWVDFDTDSDLMLNYGNTPTSPGTAGESWRGYPEALFGNWKPDQVKRSKMLSNSPELGKCSAHWLDVLTNGAFTILDEEGQDQTSTIAPERINEFWALLQRPVSCSLFEVCTMIDASSIAACEYPCSCIVCR